MAKTMKNTTSEKEDEKMIVKADGKAGKAYLLSFRTGVHTDKKKKAKKSACRKTNKSDFSL